MKDISHLHQGNGCDSDSPAQNNIKLEQQHHRNEQIKPPSGFSPPMNNNNRKPSKVNTVLTASASASSITSPRLTRSCTKQQQLSIKTDERISTLNVLVSSKKSSEKSKGLRDGPSPKIASISADLDLAASESIRQVQFKKSQPCQETLQQIDAIVATDGDQEDDTDLGFNFGPSPTRMSPKGTFQVVDSTSMKFQTWPSSLPTSSPPHSQYHSQGKQTPQHNLPTQIYSPSVYVTSYTGSHPGGRPIHNIQPKSQFSQNNTMENNQGFPTPQRYNVESTYRQYHQYEMEMMVHSQKFPLSKGSIQNKTYGDQRSFESCDRKIDTIISSPGKENLNRKVNINIGTNEKISSEKKHASDFREEKTDAGLRTKNGVLLRSPPMKKRRVVESWDEQERKAENALLASPANVFRSPAKNNLKQSPLFTYRDEDYNDRYNLNDPSFGMESPARSKFDDMFQSRSFDDLNSPYVYGQNITLSRTMSEDDNITRSKLQSSPCGIFGDALSPFRSSPVSRGTQFLERGFTPKSGGNVSLLGVFEASPVPPRPNRDNSNISIPSLPSKKDCRSRPVFPIKSSPNKIPPPRQSPPFASPGTFRLQIGNMCSMTTSEARKGIEGINTVVNGRAMDTPMKSDLRPVSTPLPGLNTSGCYPGSGQQHPGLGTLPHTGHSYMKFSATPAKSPIDKNSSSPDKRRNPCNCKKSNCLKLYCVCFASELYCDGCNCHDCSNTKEKDAIRVKAIKDTKAKNPHAFKPRFSSKHDIPKIGSRNPMSAKGHNMGCRCKKSQCLKKYCECFEAAALCSQKCKCVDCQNYLGSQQLIDRRRKIKDEKGAEVAMRPAHPVWKQGVNHIMPPPTPVFPSPASRMGQPPLLYSMMSPPGAPTIRHGGPMHGYMGHPHMIMAPMRYSPIGMQPVTPYSASSISHRPNNRERQYAPTPRLQRTIKDQNRVTPQLSTPKTPAARKGFDPYSKNKKNGEKEPTKDYFGPGNEPQTKTIALSIFSFLSNDDLYNASLVSHAWSKLSLDEELWQFEVNS
mmetsp:Transcript_2855/g.3348  ORF Transcript_2855/g.3348 Transcript_2855/m.3348 type:complete len:1028 (+) Transcript_2855:399-3482(+)